MLRAAASVKPGDDLDDDEQIGYDIVLRACRSPLYRIAENAGQDGGIVCEKVLDLKGNNGYNALTDVFSPLSLKLGVGSTIRPRGDFPTMPQKNASNASFSFSLILLSKEYSQVE